MTSASLRLFVAAEIPPALREACTSLLAEARHAFPAARWARPEGMHLTLKFLGATPEERLDRVTDAIAAPARRAAPFDLLTGPAGLFGPPSRPRVFWIALEGDLTAAGRLVKDLEDEAALLGFAREERPFRPHLTLARFDPARGATLPEDLLARAERALAGIPFPVGEVVLFQSILGPAGSRYVPQRRFPLGTDLGA